MCIVLVLGVRGGEVRKVLVNKILRVDEICARTRVTSHAIVVATGSGSANGEVHRVLLLCAVGKWAFANYLI